MKMSPPPARSEMDDPKTAEEARASVVDCGEVPFPLPTNRKPSTETGAAHIICHPELAKDLTAGQPALGHHSPFSKLTAPPDEPSVPIMCRLKRTSRSPREIPSTDSGQALRRLRMTTFGAPFSLLRPICKLVGNGKESPPLSKRLFSGITQSVSCAHRLVAVEANRPRRSPISLNAGMDLAQRPQSTQRQRLSTLLWITVRVSHLGYLKLFQPFFFACLAPLREIFIAVFRIRRWRDHNAPRLRRSEWSHVRSR